MHICSRNEKKLSEEAISNKILCGNPSMNAGFEPLCLADLPILGRLVGYGSIFMKDDNRVFFVGLFSTCVNVLTMAHK